jgi:putative ABC transport system permease protein
VSQRRTEIGIRMALGARTADVLRLVLGRSGVAIVAGAAIGVAGAPLMGRVASRFLYGVSPSDLLSVGIAVAVLACAAIGASLVPARRATRVDAVTAIRSE